MILAAGFGTRLLPHTLVCPKPLFPILNQPLLLLTVKRLQKLGFDRIVVNCHHLREKIVAALAGLAGVVVQEEEIILGTGGGLRRALGKLRNEPLLVTNGDIYHNIDLLDLYRRHLDSGDPVTLAMHHHPRFNRVMVKDGKVASFDNRVEFSQLAFTGLHVIDPAILEGVDDNRFSSIIDLYRRLLHRGTGINCYRADGCYWTDMGTPEDYLDLHQGLLSGVIPCWPELGPVRRPYCIDQRARLPAHLELRDWVSIGAATIENNTRLERVVIWDDVLVPGGSTLVDSVVSTAGSKELHSCGVV